MAMGHGEEIHFSLRTTDANAAPVLIVLFNAATKTARTLQANEIIEVNSISVVALATGDFEVYIGDSAASAVGETVVRGDFSANGGIVQTFEVTARAGEVGKNLFITAEAVTTVNINGTGRLRKG